MANDINDDAELIPDHSEAWSLAHHKCGTSNLARAYIELRDISHRMAGGTHTPADARRLVEIVKANDL